MWFSMISLNSGYCRWEFQVHALVETTVRPFVSRRSASRWPGCPRVEEVAVAHRPAQADAVGAGVADLVAADDVPGVVALQVDGVAADGVEMVVLDAAPFGPVQVQRLAGSTSRPSAENIAPRPSTPPGCGSSPSVVSVKVKPRMVTKLVRCRATSRSSAGATTSRPSTDPLGRPEIELALLASPGTIRRADPAPPGGFRPRNGGMPRGWNGVGQNQEGRSKSRVGRTSVMIRFASSMLLIGMMSLAQ